jgi:hypothetical protein
MHKDLELSEAIHQRIEAHCAEGDKMAEARRFEDAIAEYNKAWILVPEPKNDWHAATWVLAAIADAAYLNGYATTAREAIEYGMTCPGAVGNPFMHLRFGQILLDANEQDRAADELMRAYMGAGPEIFASEDSRYISFLKTRAMI